MYGAGSLKCREVAFPPPGEWKLRSWLFPQLETGRIVPDRGFGVRCTRTSLTPPCNTEKSLCAQASVAIGEGGSKIYVPTPRSRTGSPLPFPFHTVLLSGQSESRPDRFESLLCTAFLLRWVTRPARDTDGTNRRSLSLCLCVSRCARAPARVLVCVRVCVCVCLPVCLSHCWVES